ncbi:MAG: hypothetical protein ACI9CD_000826 [Candidatus Deianiraeaceae bacterium]|jgi:hypothetical protein
MKKLLKLFAISLFYVVSSITLLLLPSLITPLLLLCTLIIPFELFYLWYSAIKLQRWNRKYEYIYIYNNSFNNTESCMVSYCSTSQYDERLQHTQEGNEYFKDNQDEFVKLPDSKAIFHTYPRNKKGIIQTFGRVKGYEKYVHPIYGYEVVIDTNNNNSSVTDPVNMGTYNYYNPYMGVGNELLEDSASQKDLPQSMFGKHADFDVKPYYIYGNTPSDSTTNLQRINRNLELLNQ